MSSQTIPDNALDEAFGATPTLSEQDTRSGMRRRDTESRVTELTMPATVEEADAAAAQAAYNAANLGFGEANKVFQKDVLVPWRSQEASSTFKKIRDLKKAVDVLRSGKQLTGPVFNQLPDFVRNVVNPESTAVRQSVEKVVQDTMRQTLGAQFTQKEGENVLQRTYNADLPEELVLDAVSRELIGLQELAASKEAMVRHYEQFGTVKGYKPGDYLPSVRDEYKINVAESPKAVESAAKVNYRDSLNNIGGTPLQGWRFPRGAEKQIAEYVNSSDFTPDGYVNMMQSLAEETVGRSFDEKTLRNQAVELAKRPEGQRMGSIDYSKVDEKAVEEAGFSDVAAQALKNAPTSAVLMANDLLSPASDALRSVVLGERVGIYKTLPDLAADLASKTGIIETDEETADALADVLAKQYGSLSGFKNAVAEDPVGVLGDVSLIFGGAGAATKVAGLGRAGETLSKVGRGLDPISAMGGVATRGLGIDTSRTAEKAGEMASETLSLTSGAPASAIREAFNVGRERTAAGAPTARSEAFGAAIKGETPVEEIVGTARGSMDDIRNEISQQYRSGMVDISKDREVLSFDKIDETLDQMLSDATFGGKDVKPETRKTVEDLAEIIGDWKASDPSVFHTPEGLDKLKQRISETVENVPSDQRSRTRAASKIYNSVKDTIAEQAPAYREVMEQYESGMETLGRIEREFSLGRKNTVDTAFSKLRSRPGSRPGRDDLVELLSTYDPVVGAQIAGEQLSDIFPGGLRGAGTGMAVVGGAVTSPLATPAAIAGSPRMVGRGAYYTGRAAEPAAMATRYLGANPMSRLAIARGSAYSDDIEDELSRMAQNYLVLPEEGDGGATSDPNTAANVNAAAAQMGGDQEFIAVDREGRKAEPDNARQAVQTIDGRPTGIDQVTGRRVFLDTGEPVPGFKRGGEVESGKPTFGDRARSVAQGVTFGFGDEIEGGVRALGSALSEGDLMSLRQKYLQERDAIRAQQQAYEDANLLESLALEGGGAMLTGFIPGGQGAAAARMAQLASRYPKAMRAANVAADTALYGAGSADSMSDIPRSIRDEAVFAVPMYGGAEGVRYAVKRRKARKGKKK